MVRAKWQKLSDAEKERYEISGTQQVSELKKRVAAGRKLAQKLDKHIQPVGFEITYSET